jgi:hypothetical protein
VDISRSVILRRNLILNPPYLNEAVFLFSSNLAPLTSYP